MFLYILGYDNGNEMRMVDPSSEISANKTSSSTLIFSSNTTCNITITILSGAKPPTDKPLPGVNVICAVEFTLFGQNGQQV